MTPVTLRCSEPALGDYSCRVAEEAPRALYMERGFHTKLPGTTWSAAFLALEHYRRPKGTVASSARAARFR